MRVRAGGRGRDRRRPRSSPSSPSSSALYRKVASPPEVFAWTRAISARASSSSGPPTSSKSQTPVGGGDVADPVDRGGGERAARPLGGDPAVQPLGLGEDPAEVVGGQAGDELAVANGRGEPAADLRQRAVAGEAPVLGVDPLEAVDVDEDERERALVALRAPRLGAQLLVEGAVIGEVRQLVAGARARPAGRSRRRTRRRAALRRRARADGRDRRLRRRARPRAGRRRGSVRRRARPRRCGRPVRPARLLRAGRCVPGTRLCRSRAAA